MKQFKKVADRVEDYRYKKGIVRISTKSPYYKACKILYVLSFIWMMFFLLTYIFGVTVVAADNSGVKPEILITTIPLACVSIAGLVLVFLKKHLYGLTASFLGSVGSIIYFLQDPAVRLDLVQNVISSKYLWRHFAPALLVTVFALIVCLIGLKIWYDFREDYKKVMDSMYLSFKEKNPSASDAEWQDFLGENDNADA